MYIYIYIYKRLLDSTHIGASQASLDLSLHTQI